MTMSGLTISSCGKGAVMYNNPTIYGVTVHSVMDTGIANCSFQDSVGTALGVFHSNLDIRGSNYFTSNCRGCFERNYTFLCFGGGIYANISTLVFTGNITFKHNTAEYGGGILASGNTLMTFNGNSSFRDNSAEYGGGIAAWDSTLNFSGSSTFGSNSAEYGGGIDALSSTLNFSGSSTFGSNSAEYGGGIYALSSTLNFSGSSTSTFGSNSVEYRGGGIDAGRSTLNFCGSSTFGNNSAEFGGGGIDAGGSTLNFCGSSTFGNNSAEFGGGINAGGSTLNFSGSSTFGSNSAEYGGGIYALSSTLNFSGSSTFGSNSAEYGGGIFALSSTLNISGSSTFGSNSAAIYGGGLFAWGNSLITFNENNIFENNLAAVSGGGIYIFQQSNLSFTGNVNFTHNSAKSGGGMSVLLSEMNLTGSCIFTNNSANGFGGGIFVFFSTLNFNGYSTFGNNSAGIGGGIFATASTLRITADNIGKYSGTSHFLENSARIHGGAVFTEDSALSFQACSNFSGNSAQYSAGGIYSKNSNLTFNGSTSFNSNSGQLLGGGIYGLGTLLYFTGNCSFTANTAARGGGEYLANSINLFSQAASATMDSNNATEYGGAVYVEDSDPISYCSPENINLENCPFQVDEVFQASRDDALQLFSIYLDPTGIHEFLQSNQSIAHRIRALLNISIHFSNNHAKRAGSAVYGGSVDSCINYLRSNVSNIQAVISFNWYVPNLELEPNSISSDPFQVCLCKDGDINCNTSELDRQMRVYPGQLLKLPVVATGQRDGIVPAVVRALFNATHKNVTLAPFQDTQNVLNGCTELYYQVYSSSSNNSDTLVLYADGPCSTDGKTLDISLEFLDCPSGFSLNPSEGACECEPRLQEYTTRCNITERELERSGVFWVGYDNKSGGLILHSHCPFDYCISANINVTLNDTDKQCANNRAGLLCGECKSGFSLTLGSSKCLECSNIWILLLIPFALAGIALVLLLFILKLTVAAGTINGLIFYANIVAINRSIFFPPNETTNINILTVFIAWLNLDLGIETCFFEGLDAYVKTWLQFVFPLYVWSLAGLIIVASEYSSRVTRVFGSNPVAVLATLFLLSYAKLLRTILDVLSFTFLYYPDEVRVAVWQYDGNIQFIYGKHIALFLVALSTFLVLFLPYTILLTVGQWLQAKSNRRFFRWINNPRIKPFLDAYQAPYRDQHRYWTGLMLCLRCVLFTAFVLLSLVSADPSHNLPAIEAVVIGLITLTRFTGLIYKKLYLDVLEASFILNLGILAAATYSVRLVGTPSYESQAAVTYTSVSVAFATFVVVLTYHIYQQVWPKLLPKIHKLRHRNEHQSERFDEEANIDKRAQVPTAPTMTIVERPSPAPLEVEARPLRVPTNFTELREPLNLVDTSDL